MVWLVLFWLAVFVISLAALVKGADWLLVSAEKIGLALGLSPFIVGVLIVGAGTSFPELVSSLFAVLSGASEIAVANAVGSNIANMLLIVGVSSLLAWRLVVTKDLIDLDLPLLAISTVLFLIFAADGHIGRGESLLLLAGYVVYLGYTIFYQEDAKSARMRKLPSRVDRRRQAKRWRKGLKWQDFIWLLFGLLTLMIGAKYLIDAVINLSQLLAIAPGVISLAAVAVGTSLPELLVSAKAAWRHKSDIALGNIFGSNVFNILVVIGLPGLISPLVIDQATYTMGLPMLALATLLFIISGISRRIHIWEGTLYLVVYAAFLGKIFKVF